MIVGTRTLTVQTSDGERPLEIRMYAPQQVGAKWDCWYEIDWPEGAAKSHAQGNDALHALHLAMQKIGTDLHRAATTPSARCGRSSRGLDMASRCRRTRVTC